MLIGRWFCRSGEEGGGLGLGLVVVVGGLMLSVRLCQSGASRAKRASFHGKCSGKD